MSILSSLTDIWKDINKRPVSQVKLTSPPLKDAFSSASVKESFNMLKRAAPSAAAAASAPVIVGSGLIRTGLSVGLPIVKRGAVTASKNLGSYTLAHPINTLKIGAITTAGGIVGYNAIKANPKIVSEGVPAAAAGLSDFGGTIGDVSKSKTFGEAYGHLKDFIQEHPVIASAGIGGALIAGGSGINTLLTRQKLDEIKDVIQQQQPLTASGASEGGGDYTPTSSSMEIVPDVTPQKRAVTRYKRRKTKSINRSPITIKNYNILGVRSGKY